jgi:ATP-dependent Clp protease ATP-binding subunit ClpB
MLRLNVHLDPYKTGRDAESLRNGLNRLIIGQPTAIDAIVNQYSTLITGMCQPGRPIGNFLFLGPTGSGKTRTVEATAEVLMKDPRAVIKIDCAEFQHSHEIAKLIGSPPGYLGHRETHPLLSQEVLNQFHTDTIKLSFVLFDEIEKASDSLWNLLLGIMDKAKLTLGDNRKVDFSRAMIFMTSNLGADKMISQYHVGFDRPTTPNANKLSSIGVGAARKKFTPEFFNRLDRVVVFEPLLETGIRRILDLELNLVQQRIFNTSPERSFVFTCTERAKDLVSTEGFDKLYGARFLKRAIERLLVQPLSNLIATEQVRGGDWISIDIDDSGERLVFVKQSEGLSVPDMVLLVDTSITVPVPGGGNPQVARNSKR